MSSKATENLTNQQEEQLKELNEILESYTPDWAQIIDTNQHKGQKNDNDDYNDKIAIFCKLMSDFRNGRKLSLRKFAQICKLSHTYIRDIENNKIKRLPSQQIEGIAEQLHTSVAYLIGLVESSSYVPCLVEMFFWENPNSPYKSIKEIAIESFNDKGRQEMISVFSTPIDILEKEMIKLLHNDIKLADTIYTLLSASPKKRYRYIKILEQLKEF